jgi:ribosomal protein S17
VFDYVPFSKSNLDTWPTHRVKNYSGPNIKINGGEIIRKKETDNISATSEHAVMYIP